MGGEEHGKKSWGTENPAGKNAGEKTFPATITTLKGNQAKMHSGKGGQQGGPAHGQHAMNQHGWQHQQQMGGRNPKWGRIISENGRAASAEKNGGTASAKRRREASANGRRRKSA